MRRLAILLAVSALALLLCGCGATATKRVEPSLNLEPTDFRTEVNRWPDPKANDLDFMEVYDPWEPMNRHIYDFNAGLDAYVLLPAVEVYKTVLPGPARKGVSNVINNLNELPVLFNCLLQGKMKKGAITTSRFFINSTFGVLGLMDVASGAEHLKRQEEDVGQTLGFWGVGNGPYFVMPAFGPSNVRDTVGFGGDFLLLYLEMKEIYRLAGVKNTWDVSVAELVIRSLNRRASVPFRYHETGSPFEYEMVRYVYTKKRELDIQR
ncbi:MAG: VacJ family lipoprotein [Pseudodesulfovibrio sp.]|uniref:VacJ family lipoprotein n=1 Tax=Pseudodesulfovibrio aespoeensis (strain ATCC 700646 / DSM 10631 / Aspo-2) TaxID=643562 RepID=E6VUX3_PSEA9|nr:MULTISPECIES: VacJ family lipoprotein [Pseudodesulfovibrio]MBU4191368.1 VacJ family lipoprotein [Pseudomonadota bacterium]ADU63481.1 VacJ family lipoprotein [Pseudodesulfovibrio aespoeensis Aspo-2]MBU4244746.1 VacJ family lipoprotein [Pseudomonadota bacterium]MBU4377710.1 VacJ family lipoprotein [Pseudomonadota bacterium]MBU4476445.1 VacJ family lipoprotein [Pseudomonadota bacterium]